MTLFLFILLMALAYLAGSLNVSILLLQWQGRDDPRQHFSKNPGATNVWRQAGAGWALAVLLLDTGKALGMAVLAMALLPPAYWYWIGLMLILGNRFPCFHGFQGGKGVAHYLGFSVVFAPLAALAGIGLWLVIHKLWRQPFLGSLAMVLVLSIALMVNSGWHSGAVVGTLLTTLLIVVNHHHNINAYIRG